MANGAAREEACKTSIWVHAVSGGTGLTASPVSLKKCNSADYPPELFPAVSAARTERNMPPNTFSRNFGTIAIVSQPAKRGRNRDSAAVDPGTPDYPAVIKANPDTASSFGGNEIC
jgi:hypothetical protein